jgi:glycosyltransferase involved in cell wall biosynthesis
VLQGEQGTAQKELEELVVWLRDEFRPDLVHITNSMFLGLVRRLKEELGVPVVVAVQGEDLFIEDLPPAYRDKVVAEMRARAPEADAFMAPNRFYTGKMSKLLAVPEEKMQVVPLGLKLAGHDAPQVPQVSRAGTSGRDSAGAPVIGYLARICPEKGLHLLVDAFCRIASKPGNETLRLRVAGYLGPKDRPYYRKLEKQIIEAELIDRYDFLGEVDRHSKITFLRSLDLLSVPTVYQEAKGLFVLEALANGVPVVQPRHGSFPELLDATGGGILVEPLSAEALAEGITTLLDDPDRRRNLGASGRRAVLERFSDHQMAAATLAFYQALVREARPTGALTDQTP